MTYPQTFVSEIIEEHCIPVQYDNTKDESKPVIDRYRHIWTPDIRLLEDNGNELYRWNGYLPPAEFAPRLLTGLAHARLRLRQFDRAEPYLKEVLTRFPTSFAAPEAQYFTAVTAYRKSGDSKDLNQGWSELEKIYPNSEWTVKQNFG